MATVTLERKRAHEAAGSARARVTTYDVLHGDGDVVRPGSLRNRFATVSRHGHSSLAGREPLAGVAELFDEPDGLYAKVEFLEGEEAACELARDATWSVGFVVVASHPPTAAELAEFGPKLTRVITAWKILEVSVVEKPASPGTRTASICCGAECEIAAGKSCCAQCATREAARIELARFERTRARLIFPDAKRRLDALDADRRALETNELRPSEVPDDVRAAAEHAVEVASKILRIPAPRVRWYSYEAALEMEAAGIAWKGEGAVWIATGRDPEATYGTTAHEIAHVAGFDERRAKQFGESLALLRDVELRIGARRQFEGVLEPLHKGTVIEGLGGFHRVGALDTGSLVVDDLKLYERVEVGQGLTWREVATLA